MSHHAKSRAPVTVASDDESMRMLFYFETDDSGTKHFRVMVQFWDSDGALHEVKLDAGQHYINGDRTRMLNLLRRVWTVALAERGFAPE